MSANYSQSVQKNLYNLHLGGKTDVLPDIVNVIHGKSWKERIPLGDITQEITTISYSWHSHNISHVKKY